MSELAERVRDRYAAIARSIDTGQDASCCDAAGCCDPSPIGADLYSATEQGGAARGGCPRQPRMRQPARRR